MKRSTLITLLILLLIIAIVGFFAWQAIKNSQQKPVEPSAAEASLFSASSSQPFTDFAGNQANLEQYREAVIVVHAWASWVPTSPQSLQDLATLQKEYEAENVIVLAINRGEPPKTARQFIDSYNIVGVRLITDQADQYFNAVDGKTMPETIFYDREGNITYHKRGVMTLDEMRVRTNQTLRTSQ